ncbi:MAG TPA: SDR family NAD(P)-dependent oxidoreductase, partial [Candidatus Acidoferrum sp.]|nr:SDR family NAD(P)-dependent oxidoreductase [Candidatus Acidoferrum sp.]
MDGKTVALAGGSGFIGRAIARRLIAGGIKVRVLTRNREKARAQLDLPGVDFVPADIAQPASLKDALNGAETVVDAIQFDGYPVENPRRGLTFERIDYGGAIALIDAAKQAGVKQFIYISGAAADQNSNHPGFRAKGRAERVI